ncbi:hypothetical protein D9601_13470 [Sphingomonas sp. MA1305]|nr:hypothetical protein [Sphingomonas sp. MA1305]
MSRIIQNYAAVTAIALLYYFVFAGSHLLIDSSSYCVAIASTILVLLAIIDKLKSFGLFRGLLIYATAFFCAMALFTIAARPNATSAGLIYFSFVLMILSFIVLLYKVNAPRSRVG